MSACSLYAGELYIGAVGTKIKGEHIFETGNKYPNLSGIRGGSRITYNRDHNLGGIGLNYFSNAHQFHFNLLGTGWYVNPGNSRDEDFVMGDTSTEKGGKVSMQKGFVYDTAHTFTGTRNFADGHTKSRVYEYKTDLLYKYYFSGNSFPGSNQNSFFLVSGLYYNYFKYRLYDVIQFVNSRPIFLGPIGIGLTYTFSSVEIPIGIGYRYNITNKLYTEISLEALLAANRERDFHIQRALNFIGRNYGSGYNARANFHYNSPIGIVFLGINFHRQFTEGKFKTKGGLSDGDVMSNYLNGYKSYVNSKDYRIEFGFLKGI